MELEVKASMKNVKWRKLALQELKASGGCLSLAKLQKRLLKKAGLQGSSSAQAQLLKRLTGGSKFCISDGQVQLA